MKIEIIDVLIVAIYGVDPDEANSATVAWAAAYIARELGQGAAQAQVDRLNERRHALGLPLVHCTSPFAATDEGGEAEYARFIIRSFSR